MNQLYLLYIFLLSFSLQAVVTYYNQWSQLDAEEAERFCLSHTNSNEPNVTLLIVELDNI